MSKISIDARRIRSCTEAAALAFVDHVLADAQQWSPSLVAYRLQSKFQQDSKIEVGCWLLLARQLGFLARLQKRIDRALREAPAPAVTGANDTAHRILNTELAPAMVVYYLTATGWMFNEWEPKVQRGDVDVRLFSPTGTTTDLQVKAPDQPGEVVNNRRRGGEYDHRVLAAIDKAADQLEASPGPCRLVVISPQRTFGIEADELALHLVGRTSRSRERVWLMPGARGAFARVPGARLSAVADLHLLRGVEDTLYRCTVFTNPWGERGSKLAASAFPHGRVCSLREGTFVWEPEEPERCFVLPTGTRYHQAEV